MAHLSQNVKDPINAVWWQDEFEGRCEIFYNLENDNYSLYETPLYGGYNYHITDGDLSELIKIAEELA